MTNALKIVSRDISAHLTPETLAALRKGTLPLEEKLAALEHVSRCSRCADLLAAGFDREDLLAPPVDFAADVRRKAKNQGPEITDLVRPEVLKKEFRRYCLKVACAACAAVILLMTGAFDYSVDLIAAANEDKEHSVMGNMTENIKGFSDLFFDPEVLEDDQNEK
ncbi:MAG: hypothetical protein IJO79_02830 [Firmicutes bacterium]|nr:hypothetical protein [Clostridiales bacterium]MBQ9931261.1 hypothetical protein [Bacillota bacterium]